MSQSSSSIIFVLLNNAFHQFPTVGAQYFFVGVRKNGDCVNALYMLYMSLKPPPFDTIIRSPWTTSFQYIHNHEVTLLSRYSGWIPELVQKASQQVSTIRLFSFSRTAYLKASSKEECATSTTLISLPSLTLSTKLLRMSLLNTLQWDKLFHLSIPFSRVHSRYQRKRLPDWSEPYRSLKRPVHNLASQLLPQALLWSMWVSMMLLCSLRYISFCSRNHWRYTLTCPLRCTSILTNPGQHEEPACLLVVTEARIADLLLGRPEGLPASELASRSGLDAKRLTRILRLLATKHCFKESKNFELLPVATLNHILLPVKPGVFANNRLSMKLLSSDTVSSIVCLLYIVQIIWLLSDTSWIIPCRTDESLLASAYLNDTLTDPSEMDGGIPFRRATGYPFFDFHKTVCYLCSNFVRWKNEPILLAAGAQERRGMWSLI